MPVFEVHSVSVSVCLFLRCTVFVCVCLSVFEMCSVSVCSSVFEVYSVSLSVCPLFMCTMLGVNTHGFVLKFFMRYI